MKPYRVAEGQQLADLLGVNIVSEEFDDGLAVGVDHVLALLL